MIISNTNDLDLQITKASYAFAIAGNNTNYAVNEQFALQPIADDIDRSDIDRKAIQKICTLLQQSFQNLDHSLNANTTTRLSDGIRKFMHLHSESFSPLEIAYLNEFLLKALASKTTFVSTFTLLNNVSTINIDTLTILNDLSTKKQSEQLEILHEELKTLYISQKLITLLFNRTLIINELLRLSDQLFTNCEQFGLNEILRLLKISLRTSTGETTGALRSDCAKVLLDVDQAGESGRSALERIFIGMRKKAAESLLAEKTAEIEIFFEYHFSCIKPRTAKEALFLHIALLEQEFTSLKTEIDDQDELINSHEMRYTKYQPLRSYAAELKNRLSKKSDDEVYLFEQISNLIKKIINRQAYDSKEKKELTEKYTQFKIEKNVVQLSLTEFKNITSKHTLTDNQLAKSLEKPVRNIKKAMAKERRLAEQQLLIEKQLQALSLNDTEPTVEPSSAQQSEPTFLYHTRVNRWWNKEENPFEHDPTYSQKNYSSEAKAWISAAHNFALITDTLLDTEAIVNGNQISLIGEICLHGKTKQGVFTYVFDKEGVCYHRFFTSRTYQETLLQHIEKGFYDLSHPSHEPNSPAKTPPNSLTADGSSISSMTKSIITIDDPKNEATIRICRVH